MPVVVEKPKRIVCESLPKYLKDYVGKERITIKTSLRKDIQIFSTAYRKGSKQRKSWRRVRRERKSNNIKNSRKRWGLIKYPQS